MFNITTGGANIQNQIKADFLSLIATESVSQEGATMFRRVGIDMFQMSGLHGNLKHGLNIAHTQWQCAHGWMCTRHLVHPGILSIYTAPHVSGPF